MYVPRQFDVGFLDKCALFFVGMLCVFIFMIHLVFILSNSMFIFNNLFLYNIYFLLHFWFTRILANDVRLRLLSVLRAFPQRISAAVHCVSSACLFSAIGISPTWRLILNFYTFQFKQSTGKWIIRMRLALELILILVIEVKSFTSIVVWINIRLELIIALDLYLTTFLQIWLPFIISISSYHFLVDHYSCLIFAPYVISLVPIISFLTRQKLMVNGLQDMGVFQASVIITFFWLFWWICGIIGNCLMSLFNWT